MLWEGKVPYVSPRPGTYLSYCPSWPVLAPASQPGLCLKCTEQAWGQLDGTSEEELAEAQDGLDQLNTMLALIRLGFTPQEAGGTLGVSEQP